MSDRDLEAQAGEYVLGTLAGADRAAFEARLDVEPGLSAAVAAWEERLGSVLAGAPPVEPRPQVWSWIEARLRARQAETFGGVTVRADAGEWQKLAPGADIKVLLVDTATRVRTFLLRLQPGAQVPGHPHPSTEECYVLSGDMMIGETTFFPGDFHAATVNIDHPAITSRGGGLIFIRGPIYD
jgi:hypothetical protein